MVGIIVPHGQALATGVHGDCSDDTVHGIECLSPSFTDREEVPVDTPYGSPTSGLIKGKIGRCRACC
jgi:hypothetical protein